MLEFVGGNNGIYFVMCLYKSIINLEFYNLEKYFLNVKVNKGIFNKIKIIKNFISIFKLKESCIIFYLLLKLIFLV